MTTYIIVCSTIVVLALIIAVFGYVSMKSEERHQYRMKYPPKEPKKPKVVKPCTTVWTNVPLEPVRRNPRHAAKKEVKRGKAK